MSLGRSVPAAIDASLPDGLAADTQITYPARQRRGSRSRCPDPIFPGFTVTREATMPRMVP